MANEHSSEVATSERISRWLFSILALTLIVGVIAIYAQTHMFDFLTYDDRRYTTVCPFVSTGLSGANVLQAFRELAWGGIYMPITYITYMIDISFFGGTPGVHHVASVVFHAFNSVLFFSLLVSVFLQNRKSPLALFASFAAAALWAYHPLRVESVAWVASRKDVLFTFFTLIGLLAWSKEFRWAAIPMMLLGCLCKPTAMVFPALALSLDLIGKRRLTVRRCLPYIPLLILSCATAALAAYSQTRACSDGIASLYSTTFGWRMLNATVSLGLYFWHFAVPVGLQYLYRPIRDGLPLHTPLGLSAALTCLGVYCFAVWKFKSFRCPLLVTGFWFLASIGPTLGILGTFGNHALADRFTYVPMMAISILILLILSRMEFKPLLSSVLLLASCGYGLMAYSYAQTYRTNRAAVENMLAHDQEDFDAWTDLGNDLIMRGNDLNKAIDCFRKSLRLNPTVSAKRDLIVALMMRNDTKDEGEVVEQAMSFADWKTSPAEGVIPLIPAEYDQHGVISRALGDIAVRHKDWKNAARCFGQSYKHSPNEETVLRIGECYLKVGDAEGARKCLEPLMCSSNSTIASKAKALMDQSPCANAQQED